MLLQTKQIGQESKERKKSQQAPIFCVETDVAQREDV
jgi:hypothetical protein